MSIISFSNVSKSYSSDEILNHISFNVNKGEKVALIGNNGTGKTTIFKLILGLEEPSLVPKEDKPGSIGIARECSVGYLDQNCITNINNTVEEELLLVFEKQIRMEKEIEDISKMLSKDPNNSDIVAKYNSLLFNFEKERGYTYKNEIREMVSRFNFDDSYFERKISSLSGGERMKIAFIKILLFNYDVLLLDEPTNHIDVSTIEWLEQFLKTYDGTVFFISHDRYFLSSLATKVIELENKKVVVYNTTYDNYLVQKQLNFETLMKQYEKEEEMIAKYKRFIEFYMPKPRFASRAKDRVKKLEKIEANRTIIEKSENRKISIKIDGNKLNDRQILQFSDLEVGYDHALSKSLNFILYSNDRLAIVGDNGIGKTTLVKTIVSELKPFSGEIKHLRKIEVGYIKQNDYAFEKDIDAIGYLRSKYPAKSDSEIRGALGKFLFKADDIFKSCNLMSNGEKMRLILCALCLSSYDVLILDEPTNHLDMVTKECLLEALKKYNGAIIFVSHDRYFINELATHTIYMSKKETIFHEGNYDDFKVFYDKKIAPKEDITLVKLEEKLSEKPKKENLSNNALTKLNNELKNIEKRIDEIDNLFVLGEVKIEDYESLNNEKSELEQRYIEILDILENNN